MLNLIILYKNKRINYINNIQDIYNNKKKEFYNINMYFNTIQNKINQNNIIINNYN